MKKLYTSLLIHVRTKIICNKYWPRDKIQMGGRWGGERLAIQKVTNISTWNTQRQWKSKEKTNQNECRIERFGKVERNLYKHLPISPKTRGFCQRVLSTMAHGCHTRSNKSVLKRLETSQRTMEREILNAKPNDRIWSTPTIRQRTRVTYMADYVTNAKWKWAEHIINDNRWTITSTEWQATKGIRAVRRPKRLWRNDVVGQHETAWRRTGKDRESWWTLGEGYLMQNTENGTDWLAGRDKGKQIGFASRSVQNCVVVLRGDHLDSQMVGRSRHIRKIWRSTSPLPTPLPPPSPLSSIESYQSLKNRCVADALSDIWCYELRAMTGWPVVSSQWLDEKASSIWHLFISVAARPTDQADPSLRYTLLLRRYLTQQQTSRHMGNSLFCFGLGCPPLYLLMPIAPGGA